MRKINSIILLFLLSVMVSNGQISDLIDGIKIDAIQNPTQNTSQTNQLVSVVDLDFNSSDQKYIDNMIVTDVVGLVRLEFNHDNISLVPDFNLSIPVQIEGLKYDGSSFSLNKTLKINYNSIKGEVYSDLAIVEIRDAVRIDVGFTQNLSISPSNVDMLDIGKMILLSASISKTAYLPFDHNSIIENTSTLIPVNGELLVSWPIQNGGKEYDLEWTHISNQGYVNGSVVNISAKDLDFNFNNNSSRVRIKKTNYKIPLLYEDGYLLWRVRAIGVVEYNGEFKEIEGRWNFEQYDNKSVIDFINKKPDQYYLIDGHEENLNWQSEVTFAEDGKNKAVISYSDGTLRSRQIVTKLNTDSIIVVGETKYDAQGRGVIQILPVPVYIGGVNQKVQEIQFVDKFNLTANGKEFNWEQFDIDNGQCAQTQIPLSINTGASYDIAGFRFGSGIVLNKILLLLYLLLLHLSLLVYCITKTSRS